MLKLKVRAVFFSFILLFISSYARADFSQELEPIVITKSRVHLLHPFTLSQDAQETALFGSFIQELQKLPLDLQSRSPLGTVQTDFSLRGSTFQGVLMLLNGQRINDPQTAHHNSDIPLTKEDIQGIEVIPGVGSSIYGPDAIGGAININIKEPEANHTVLESAIGNYQSGYGLFSLSRKNDTSGIRFSLQRDESTGFYTDTDSKAFTTSLSAKHGFDRGKFNFFMGYQEKEFGAYDFYTPYSGYLSKEWTKTYLLNTGSDFDMDGLIIRPNVIWRRHYDKFELDKTHTRSNYLNHHRTDMYTPGIYFQKETRNLGKLGAGFEYGQEIINSTNLGKHDRQHKSVFFDDSVNLFENVLFGLSARIDDYDSFDEVATGSISMRYILDKINSFSLGLSKSTRIPSFTELYYSDPVTLGNPGLSAEESLNYQLGYDFNNGAYQAGMQVFFREEEDFIDWVKRSPLQAKWQVENISNAQVSGLESYFNSRLNDLVKIESNYAYINKRIQDDGLLYKYGPNYMRHLVNIYSIFGFDFGQQVIGFTYKKKPGRRGWLIMNTAFSYDINRNCKLFFKVSNLLNVEYQEIAGIPQPGRSFEAGVRFKW
ncbi:MAG: TonB-dependent receptor [Candidatus Omnitrophota bacterium]|jgi:iron complex outermembrane receptor protein|nr:MAG: TonB-dependent receptor [Candidatus Omnitrophota bacterium]